MYRLLFFVVMITSLILSACSTGGTSGVSIEVRDPWVRAAAAPGMGGHSSMETPESGGTQGMGPVSAAYMVLLNTGAGPDKLLRVESEVAGAAELHVSEMTGEVMTMRPIDYVEVPADGKAELKPGGMHVMLIGLKRDLKAGEKIPLVLVFEQAGRLEVQAEVRAP